MNILILHEIDNTNMQESNLIFLTATRCWFRPPFALTTTYLELRLLLSCSIPINVSPQKSTLNFYPIICIILIHKSQFFLSDFFFHKSLPFSRRLRAWLPRFLKLPAHGFHLDASSSYGSFHRSEEVLRDSIYTKTIK